MRFWLFLAYICGWVNGQNESLNYQQLYDPQTLGFNSTKIKSDPLVIVDTKTIFIPNIRYSGENKTLKFWAGTGSPYTQSQLVEEKVLTANHSNIYVSFPEDLRTDKIDYFSIGQNAVSTLDYVIFSKVDRRQIRDGENLKENQSNIYRISKCCNRDQEFQPNGSCSKTNKPIVLDIPIFPSNSSGLDPETRLNKSEYEIRPFINPLTCEKENDVRIFPFNEYGLIYNSSLIIKEDSIRHLGQFCIDQYENETIALICYEIRNEEASISPNIYLPALVISMICFATSAVVYCFILKVKYIHKRCFIIFTVSMAITFLSLILIQVQNNEAMCNAIEMPSMCNICHKYQPRPGQKKKHTEEELKFYKVPSIKNKKNEVDPQKVKRREQWFTIIGVSDNGQTVYVCSNHFVTGKPVDDIAHPDYLPSINLPCVEVKETHQEPLLSNVTEAEKNLQNFTPLFEEKSPFNTQQEEFNRSMPLFEDNSSFEENIEIMMELDNSPPSKSDEAESQDILARPLDDWPEINNIEDEELLFMDQATQTSLTAEDITKMELELRRLNGEVYELRKLTNNKAFNEDTIKNDNKRTLLLTGIAEYVTFREIFLLAEPYITSHLRVIDDKFQHVLMTYMRMRLNLTFRFLALLFNCSEHTISRIFFTTLNVLYLRTKAIVYWPTRDQLQASMPLNFQEYFGDKVTVIIDCFEIFLERSSNLAAQASTWSNYKHHNTIKYLIGIAPCGMITFISKAYGGRISDKALTESCGFLDNLIPGDLVLADRGFLIEDIVRLHCAEVKTPAFLKGKKQLEPRDLEQSRHLSSVRIHVENVIGSLVQKYPILHETLPLKLATKIDDDEIAILDKIVSVCCAGVNLCPSIITQ